MTSHYDLNQYSTELSRLRAAALAIYNAGRWTSESVAPWQADGLWTGLRDALGLPKGTEASRADKERREEIRKALHAHYDHHMTTDGAVERIAALLGRKT